MGVVRVKVPQSQGRTIDIVCGCSEMDGDVVRGAVAFVPTWRPVIIPAPGSNKPPHLVLVIHYFSFDRRLIRSRLLIATRCLSETGVVSVPSPCIKYTFSSHFSGIGNLPKTFLLGLLVSGCYMLRSNLLRRRTKNAAHGSRNVHQMWGGGEKRS